jgi:hypothetical protein
MPKTKGDAEEYCKGMNIGGSKRYIPTTTRMDQSQWRAMFAVKEKINNFEALGASKANHYWTSTSLEYGRNLDNCILPGGNCGVEDSTTKTL